MATVIVDTGPLLAFFDQTSKVHPWVKARFEELTDPLYTCQAVITETLFLLKRDGLDPDWILDLVERGTIICAFDLDSEIVPVRRMHQQYQSLPSSLADICLVRMSEIHKDSVIFTLDRDFQVYRRNGRQHIPLLAPFS